MTTPNTTPENEIYDVYCMACGQTFTPAPQSRLWWKARKKAEKFLDALCVSGEECGCVQKQRQPDARYRVFGYNGFCENFDIPFDTFTAAVRKFRELNIRSGGLNIVFISGVSKSVERQLCW